MLGVFANAKYEDLRGRTVGLSPKKDVREFRVRDGNGMLGIGETIKPTWFQEGQFVDARAKSKGHGFTGVSTDIHLDLNMALMSL